MLLQMDSLNLMSQDSFTIKILDQEDRVGIVGLRQALLMN